MQPLEQDIGSELGFHRKGIQRLLELILMGKISTVIITHKDRISRFRFEWLCKRNNTTILVSHFQLQEMSSQKTSLLSPIPLAVECMEIENSALKFPIKIN